MQLPPARLPYRPSRLAQLPRVIATIGGCENENAIAFRKSLDDFEIAPHQLEPVGDQNVPASACLLGSFEQQSILCHGNEGLSHSPVGMRHDRPSRLVDVTPHEFSKGPDLPAFRVMRQNKCGFPERVLEALPLTEKNNPVAHHPGIAEGPGSRGGIKRRQKRRLRLFAALENRPFPLGRFETEQHVLLDEQTCIRLRTFGVNIVQLGEAIGHPAEGDDFSVPEGPEAKSRTQHLLDESLFEPRPVLAQHDQCRKRRDDLGDALDIRKDDARRSIDDRIDRRRHKRAQREGQGTCRFAAVRREPVDDV